MVNVDSARDLARALLADDLPNRWRHSEAVARRATAFRSAYGADTASLLMAAAFLHDIGYAPPLHETGFHPIDGALHLRRLGADERLVGMVAHHSCSCIEAHLRGLQQKLAEDFPLDPSLPHDALLFCDLTTGPTGEALTLEERFADIRRRYGPDHIVFRFIELAEPDLRAAVARARALLDPSSRQRRMIAA